MLAVQEYLQTNTIESLEQFGVFAKYHATKPYVILDYDMVEASKFKCHPIVKECRGLVLRTDDYSIIQKAYDRFFNLNESSCTDEFDWTDFSTTLKEDGSLIKVRWYDNGLLVTTRNSFAESICGESGKTWRELVLEQLTTDQRITMNIHRDKGFVFELCTEHNMVVVHHATPKLVLLNVFNYNDGYSCEENTDELFFRSFTNKTVFDFRCLDDVMDFLKDIEEAKDSTEGVVLKDHKGVRLKAKSSFYLQLHRLSGNGNITLLKNIVPIVLQGEKDEILSYFPHLKERIEECEVLLSSMFVQLQFIWEQAKELTDQKEFAIMITKNHQTPFSGILFTLKKNGDIQDFDKLKHEWNQSEALILKVLKD